MATNAPALYVSIGLDLLAPGHDFESEFILTPAREALSRTEKGRTWLERAWALKAEKDRAPAKLRPLIPQLVFQGRYSAENGLHATRYFCRIGKRAVEGQELVFGLDSLFSDAFLAEQGDLLPKFCFSMRGVFPWVGGREAAEKPIVSLPLGSAIQALAESHPVRSWNEPGIQAFRGGLGGGYQCGYAFSGYTNLDRAVPFDGLEIGTIFDSSLEIPGGSLALRNDFAMLYLAINESPIG